MPPRPHPTPWRTALAVVTTVAVVGVASGCSDDEPDQPKPSGTPSGGTTDAGTTSVATQATVRRVSGGRLTATARTKLRDRIKETVDEWFDAAYLAGEYPRTDFDDAFTVFTDGAAERARGDQLLSNAAVGTTTFGVEATAKRVVIDALAQDGRASAVTATFDLDMTRTGETGTERRERVKGRLYLTYAPGAGWRVFAYDVDRGVV